MSKFICSLALLALLGLGLMPMSANAAGRIVVYYDAAGTVRGGTSPGAGQIVNLFVYGEGFTAQFITGVQYGIDYGPDLTFITDLALPPVSIGTSATGISIGFGMTPRPGDKFLIHLALCTWNSDCSGSANNTIQTGPHPLFPDPTPIVTRFPGQDVAAADGVRSVSCELVEMDIRPSLCPNPFPDTSWDFIGHAQPSKGGYLAVTINGSDTVDPDDIDKSTLLLEGVAPIPWPQTTWFDISTADGSDACVCNMILPEGEDEDVGGLANFNPDGHKDLLIFFLRSEIAAAIGPIAPHPGDRLSMDLTGNYDSGVPFRARDCLTITGDAREDKGGGMDEEHSSDSADDAADMGLPSPNPFNPVTRISYSVPSSQHVRIAVYDVAGRLVDDLVNEVKGAGEYVVEWDAGRLPSGVYFYRMQTGSQTVVRRATLLK